MGNKINGPHASTFSYSCSKFLSLFSRTKVSYNTSRQIQQTLLTSEKCVNDLRKHDECHPCIFKCTCTKIVNLHTPRPK